jgi:hypothetical protein
MLKLIFVFTLTLTFLFPAATLAESTDNESPWLIAKPKSFDALEDFFIQNNNCDLRLNSTVIYDTKDETWWSYEKSKAKYPQINKLLNTQGDCGINISRTDLALLLNLQWPEKQGPVLLYFDIFFDNTDDSGERLFFTEEMNKKFIDKFNQVSEFTLLPKFQVRVDTSDMARPK